MKTFARLRDGLFIAVMLFVVLIAAGRQAKGQTLDYSLSASATTLLVTNPLTFYINITNFIDVPIANFVITDSLPASVQISSYNAVGEDGIVGVVTNSVATFSLLSFPSGGTINITLSTVPTATGLITNTLTISSPDLLTNAVTTLVVDVTNTVISANLGVSLVGPTQPVFTNDSTAYEIVVTNAGPDGVPDVMLTNTLPPGVILEGVVSTNLTYTQLGSNLIFDLGPIASGGTVNVELNIEPTNSGVLPYSASIGAASVTNASTLGTSATNNLTVLTFVSGVLTAVTNSGQTTDLQNGLEEQSILLSNISTTNVPAARVIVTGLPKQLYNAVGTNSGNPYVVYTAPFTAPLAPGQSVSLLLQYNPRGTFPFTNGQLQAYPAPVPDLSPPVVASSSTKINISGIFQLPDGNMLIEFPATTGQTYTVVYSDNVQFSNSMIAPPSISAPANRVQWIDYGPPATVSAPANASVRFYRVIQNP